MHNGSRNFAFLCLSGALALGLLASAWALGQSSSEAQDDTMHNCPEAGKWSIPTWSGQDGTDIDEALDTCGEGVVAVAYYIDTQTQGWFRWFAGRPEMTTLSTLGNMQGIIALGSLSPPPAAPTPTPTPAVWSDGRIGIAIEKVERLDAIPPEFPDTPLMHASYSPQDYRLSSVARGAEAGARPGEGYDYVAVYLNFARIEVELVRYNIIGSAFDWESQPSILIDTNGNRYEEQAFMARGVEFGDMSHLTGTYGFTEDTTMVLIFELPEREEPATLEFVYPFSDSESWGWGQIDITLQG